MTRLLVVVALLAACWDLAYRTGHLAGSAAAFEVAYESGVRAGMTRGLDQGCIAGRAEAWAEAYAAGFGNCEGAESWMVELRTNAAALNVPWQQLQTVAQ